MLHQNVGQLRFLLQLCLLLLCSLLLLVGLMLAFVLLTRQFAFLVITSGDSEVVLQAMNLLLGGRKLLGKLSVLCLRLRQSCHELVLAHGCQFGLVRGGGGITEDDPHHDGGYTNPKEFTAHGCDTQKVETPM